MQPQLSDSTGEKNGPTTSASLSFRMNFVVLIVAFAGTWWTLDLSS
jgi:hypothetical protein